MTRPRANLPSGRTYSASEWELLNDYAAFLVKLVRDAKLDGAIGIVTDEIADAA